MQPSDAARKRRAGAAGPPCGGASASAHAHHVVDGQMELGAVERVPGSADPVPVRHEHLSPPIRVDVHRLWRREPPPALRPQYFESRLD